MKNCNQKIKATCGVTNFATCIYYENTINTDSELDDNTCLTIEETTQDIYNQLENLDLSALGDLCLSYTTVGGKNIVKNVLLKFEEKICELSEKVNLLETTDICNKSITSCNLDLSCLDLLPCDTPINTLGDLLQAMINKICETP
jgi:hypothetical protein